MSALKPSQRNHLILRSCSSALPTPRHETKQSLKLDLILRSTPQACVSKDGQQQDWVPPQRGVYPARIETAALRPPQGEAVR